MTQHVFNDLVPGDMLAEAPVASSHRHLPRCILVVGMSSNRITLSVMYPDGEVRFWSMHYVQARTKAGRMFVYKHRTS